MDAMRDVLTSPAVRFAGAVDLERHPGGGVQPWRLTVRDRELFRATATEPGVIGMASMPSGVRLCLRIDTRTVRLRARPLLSSMHYDYDVVVDGRLAATKVVPPQKPINPKNIVEYRAMQAKLEPATGSHEVEFSGLPGSGMRSVEIWLSNVGPQAIEALEVDDGARVEPLADDRPVWVTHGSSITHSMGLDSLGMPGFPRGSGSAHSPSRTWPATAARLANVNLISLGYGGQCVLDPMVARMIAGLPRVDALSLKLGINVHNVASHGARSFAQAALGFLLTIRDAHPTVPIAVIGAIHGDWRERITHSALVLAPDREEPDPRFPTLPQMRGELQRVVALLRGRGDARIRYVDGERAFGAADMAAGLAPDRLHPNGDGYELMGRRFASLLFGADGALLPGRVPAPPAAGAPPAAASRL